MGDENRRILQPIINQQVFLTHVGLHPWASASGPWIFNMDKSVFHQDKVHNLQILRVVVKFPCTKEPDPNHGPECTWPKTLFQSDYLQQTCKFFPLHHTIETVQFWVESVKCGMQSVDTAYSVEWGLGSVECGVESGECRV